MQSALMARQTVAATRARCLARRRDDLAQASHFSDGRTYGSRYDASHNSERRRYNRSSANQI
jgi:hypothetical protein